MSMISEFKEFAMKGNVVDLAIGVIIGAAFGKIVSALVDGVIMPIIGKLTGGVDFSEAAWVLQEAVLGPDGKETAAAVAIKYGAFVLFLVVKAINQLKRKQAAEAAAPAAPPADVVLLTEIRDLLKK